MANTINADDGVLSGSAGVKTSSDGTGILALQTNGITAATIDASQNITLPNCLNTPNTFAFKNRIINGAMVIDQRNNGAEINPAIDQAYYLDRWRIGASVASKFKIGQNAGSVTLPAGYTNYLGCTSLSAYTVGAAEVFNITQRVEGFNIADLAWGTASAATVNLSFWVRSSLTGTFGGSLRNSATDRSYPFTYTISSANTWEQKSITIPGDTSGTWLTTSGIGINIGFSLGSGSTYSGTAGAWAAANYISATGATSVVGTNAATLYITGVQLEKGSIATSFDYRPYGAELSLCQRYYWRVDGFNGLTCVAAGSVYSATTTVRTYVKFPITMRTGPTFSIAGTITSSGGSGDNAISAIAATNTGIDSALLDFTAAVGIVGQGKTVYITNNASYSVNYLQATAEL